MFLSPSAGGERGPLRVRELRRDFPPVDDGARSQAIQSEERGVQRHPFPEGNKEISAG